jgi:hypothetical protein
MSSAITRKKLSALECESEKSAAMAPISIHMSATADEQR